MRLGALAAAAHDVCLDLDRRFPGHPLADQPHWGLESGDGSTAQELFDMPLRGCCRHPTTQRQGGTSPDVGSERGWQQENSRGCTRRSSRLVSLVLFLTVIQAASLGRGRSPQIAPRMDCDEMAMSLPPSGTRMWLSSGHWDLVCTCCCNGSTPSKPTTRPHRSTAPARYAGGHYHPPREMVRETWDQ